MNAPHSPNPFADHPEAQPRGWTWKGWLYLLLAVWGAFAVLIAACGGLGYFTVASSENILENLVLDEIKRHPVITQHLGPVASVKVLPKSPLDADVERPDFIVTAEGEKRRGFLWMYQSDPPRPGSYFRKIDLHLPTGEKISVK
jgi:hypothetical protein